MIKRKVTLTVDDEMYTYFSKYFEGNLIEAVNNALEKYLRDAMHRKKMLAWLDSLEEELGPPSPEAVADVQACMKEMQGYGRQAAEEWYKELKAL